MSPDRNSRKLTRLRSLAEERISQVRGFSRHIEGFTGVGKPPHVAQVEGAEITYSIVQTEEATILRPAKARHSVDIVTLVAKFSFSPGGAGTIIVREVFGLGLEEPVSAATLSPVQTEDLMQYLGDPNRNPHLLGFITQLSIQEQDALNRQAPATSSQLQ